LARSPAKATCMSWPRGRRVRARRSDFDGLTRPPGKKKATVPPGASAPRRELLGRHHNTCGCRPVDGIREASSRICVSLCPLADPFALTLAQMNHMGRRTLSLEHGRDPTPRKFPVHAVKQKKQIACFSGLGRSSTYAPVLTPVPGRKRTTGAGAGGRMVTWPLQEMARGSRKTNRPGEMRMPPGRVDRQGRPAAWARAFLPSGPPDGFGGGPQRPRAAVTIIITSTEHMELNAQECQERQAWKRKGAAGVPPWPWRL